MLDEGNPGGRTQTYIKICYWDRIDCRWPQITLGSGLFFVLHSHFFFLRSPVAGCESHVVWNLDGPSPRRINEAAIVRS